jgi:hypothetical protein
VEGGVYPVGREVIAGYCRGAFAGCPAFRFVRAAGRLVHPSDFTAWVVRGVTPGRVEPDVGEQAADAANPDGA